MLMVTKSPRRSRMGLWWLQVSLTPHIRTDALPERQRESAQSASRPQMRKDCIGALPRSNRGAV